MPRRNRVTPLGEIVAHPAYGPMMGNRGCLHNEPRQIVRSSARLAWISCHPQSRGVRRSLMTPGHYTELFFLDEATALAVGHRPCGECRAQELAAFKAAWRTARGGELPRAIEIDTFLADERGAPETRSRAWLDQPPDGVMVTTSGQQVFLRWQDAWHLWTFEGYRPDPKPLWKGASLLTAPAIVATLRAGYRPLVHPSAERRS
jgi:hypothetical protein